MHIRIVHRIFHLIAAALLLTAAAVTSGDVSAGGRPEEPGRPPDVRYQSHGEEAADLVLQRRVLVKEIRFDGNTAVSDEDLAALAGPYTGREVSFEELQELRQKLTLLYINRGYINSGLTIPDQRVRNGVVVFRVVEGRLTGTGIEGTERLRESYIEKRLVPYTARPLNINDLQRGLQLLQQDPRIRSIRAELRPGLAPGDSHLRVMLAEEKPFSLWFEGGNDYSPSIGSYGANLRFSHNNLSGAGDTLSGYIGRAGEGGLVDGEVSYAIPLSAQDTTLRISFRGNETVVVEEPFRNLDIQSRNRTLGITISHPLSRTASREVLLGLTGDYRKSRTFLLQRPFSFSEGGEDGETTEAVLRFFQEWTVRSREQVMALRSTFSAGTGAFGATVRQDGPDGRFFSWVGQVQWIRRLGESGLQALFRTDVQLTPDELLSIEKFSVGGIESVRGYRKNALVRDNGISSSLEIRVPLIRNAQGDELLQAIPFLDYGRSWNSGGGTSRPRNIASAGAGIRWSITRNILFQAFWGAALKDLPAARRDLQDRGLHFRLSARLI